MALERAAVVVFPCRARPSIVSAGASPPGSLGSLAVRSGLAPRWAPNEGAVGVVKCDQRTRGEGVGVGWERKGQDIGCPILDAVMQLAVGSGALRD